MRSNGVENPLVLKSFKGRQKSELPTREPNRRALTLMELVVVLGVLAALAAIAIPLFPNLLRRSHKVTDATQTSEIAKAIQLYQGLYTSYPNEWDLMATSSGAAPTFLPTDGSAFGGAAAIGNLTAAEVSALGRVGITGGHYFGADLSSVEHPTLNPYNTTGVYAAPTALAPSTSVFILNNASTAIPSGIRNIIAKDATARFVVFGVGARSTLIGKVLQNAPTSVPQKASFTPSNTYSRVGAIFQVAGVEMNRTERARFIATVALEDDELESTEKDYIGYYDVAAGEAP